VYLGSGFIVLSGLTLVLIPEEIPLSTARVRTEAPAPGAPEPIAQLDVAPRPERILSDATPTAQRVAAPAPEPPSPAVVDASEVVVPQPPYLFTRTPEQLRRLHDEEDPVPEYRPTSEQVRNLTENDEPDPPAPPNVSASEDTELNQTTEDVDTPPPPPRTPDDLRRLTDD
jgi:hypothetical protein